jgi:hypothetical protein
MDILYSRNDIAKYSYFFLTRNNKRTLSKIPMIEFEIYQFENPVTADRGISHLTDEYTISVVELSDEVYKKESFSHPKYRNQKNEYLQFKYSELPVSVVKVEDSRIV